MEAIHLHHRNRICLYTKTLAPPFRNTALYSIYAVTRTGRTDMFNLTYRAVALLQTQHILQAFQVSLCIR